MQVVGGVDEQEDRDDLEDEAVLDKRRDEVGPSFENELLFGVARDVPSAQYPYAEGRSKEQEQKGHARPEDERKHAGMKDHLRFSNCPFPPLDELTLSSQNNGVGHAEKRHGIGGLLS
jgi:hypothetical protein